MNIITFVVLGANGDVESVGSAPEHDMLDEHLGNLGAIALDAESAAVIGHQPWLWRIVDGSPVPRLPNQDRLAAAARDHRQILLDGSDWTTIHDVPLTDAKRAEWRAYRDALRNITDQPGFPATIAWPIKPAKEPKA